MRTVTGCSPSPSSSSGRSPAKKRNWLVEPHEPPVAVVDLGGASRSPRAAPRARSRPGSRSASDDTRDSYHATGGRVGRVVNLRRARAPDAARAPGPRAAALARRWDELPGARQDARPDARPPDRRLRGHARRLPALQPRLHALLPLARREPGARRRRAHRRRGRRADGAAARAARAGPERAADRRRGDAARRPTTTPRRCWRCSATAASRWRCPTATSTTSTSSGWCSTRRPASGASRTSPSPGTSTR